MFLGVDLVLNRCYNLNGLKIGGVKMEQPIIRLQKNAETTTNKMRIPQQIIDKWGNKFYMEIYKDYIKLIPIKDKEVK